MVGTSDVCSIDQCSGSFSSIQSAAGFDTFGSGLSTSRYRFAASGGAAAANLRKYEPVVSLMRSGGVQSTIFATDRDRWATTLACRGTEPCPAGPRATISTARGSFSVVLMLERVYLPAARPGPPPS